MFDEFVNQLIAVSVIMVVGRIFWMQKPFWSKAFGGIAYVAALYMALQSPTILALVCAIIVMTVAAKFVARRRKIRKESKERERGDVHVHNYNYPPR